MPLVFVYGTLKRGDMRSQFLAGQEFLGEVATAPRYRMYNCGEYPALVEVDTGGRSIRGELYDVSPEQLAVLDEVEGIDERLYERRRIVLLAPYDRVEAEGYVYLQSVEGLVDCGGEW